jgi:hypothetical protein
MKKVGVFKVSREREKRIELRQDCTLGNPAGAGKVPTDVGSTRDDNMSHAEPFSGSRCRSQHKAPYFAARGECHRRGNQSSHGLSDQAAGSLKLNKVVQVEAS